MVFSNTQLLEWGATLLSVYGFWLCIRHQASCFIIFLVADVAWLVSAWKDLHTALIAQQVIYIFLNLVGYILWRRDDRLRISLERLEARHLLARTGTVLK